MSCYDYNFGKLGLQQTISLKVRKFRKLKFYKRQYYRIYQYMIYLSKKVLTRIVNSNIFYKEDKQAINGKLKEIKAAKVMLTDKLAILEKNEKS